MVRGLRGTFAAKGMNMLQLLIENVSTFGADIDWLFTLIFVVVGVWFLLTEAVLFGFIFKFRRKEGQKAQYVTGEKKEHKKWISIPHALVILCDIGIIAGTIVVWINVKQTLPPADETVRVIVQQWAWTFQHEGPDGKLDTEDDITTVDEMHITAGRVYHFELTSKDVLHSFSIPVFRLKQDAVPGRTIKGWFEATKTGTFGIQCAEMCGVGHGIMGARLYIETAEEHRNWMDQNRS